MEQNWEKLYGVCSRCENPKGYYDWCSFCDNQKLVANFSNWTSGNKEIDEFIQDTQRNAKSYSTYLEWIPWEQFEELKLRKSFFYTSYVAKWVNGERKTNFWMSGTAAPSRERIERVPVIIKFLKEEFLKDKSIDLLDWCKNHYKCLNVDRFYRFYGLTLDPKSNEYGAVFQYVSDGTLRDYLQKNKHKHITWQEKVNILYYIIQDLTIVHKAGLYHGSINTFNVLMNGDWAYLAELDFSGKVDLVTTEHRKIFGIRSFTAPEILDGTKSHSQSADIYSVGMVMSEIATGDLPFHDRKDDEFLPLKICRGIRPEIKESTPEAYRKIMEACWNQDPLKRPDIFKLRSIFTKWRQNPPFNITQQLKHADMLDMIDAMNNDIDFEMPANIRYNITMRL